MIFRRRRIPPGPARNAVPKSLCLWASILASGAYLLAVALSAPGFQWLAWISLLPMFAGIRLLKPGSALAAGVFWGVALFLWSTASAAGVIPRSFLSLFLLATAPGLYMFLGAVVTARAGFNVLLLALGWLGVELAFSPLDLPNGLLARAQGNGALMHLVGGVLGYGFVAMLVALVNAVLFSLVTTIRFRPRRASLGEGAPGAKSRSSQDSQLEPKRFQIALPDARSPPGCMPMAIPRVTT